MTKNNACQASNALLSYSKSNANVGHQPKTNRKNIMPAAATATKTKTKTQAQVEPEVETKVEEEVVVDQGLVKLLEKWDKTRDIANRSQKQVEDAWIQLAKYVRDHEITKAQLHYALVEIRGMKESTAKVNVTQLMRFQTSETASEMLDRKLEGDDDITVDDLRSASVKRGEKGIDVDPVVKGEKRLIAVARYCISEAEIEDISEFTSLARKAYKIAAAKVEAAAKRNGEEEGGDTEETEADETEEGSEEGETE